MNLRRIIAIAQLTVRDAIRSRLLLALAALILIVLFAIPSLITDDTSPADRLSVILRYSLGAVMFILTVGTLWTSCVAISGDIAEHRLYLVLAKPVHRHELWLGKWMGLVSINLAILALSGTLIAIILYRSWSALPSGSIPHTQTAARLLTARIAILPELPPTFDRQIETQLAKLQKDQQPPTPPNLQELREQAKRQVIQSGMIVQPNGSLTLHYLIPAQPHQSPPYELSFAMESSQPNKAFASGVWKVSHATGAGGSIPFTNAPGVTAHILIPAFTNKAPARITIALTRTDSASTALLLLAPHGKPPELLIPVGGFGPNLCRALLIALFRLAFVAALGISMGCLLSLPVSVFAAFAVLIMLNMSGFISTVAAQGTFLEDHHGNSLTPGMMDYLMLKIITAMNVLTGPLESLNALPLLAEARLISWSMVAKALGVLGALYTAAVAVPGIYLFNRRELQ